MLKAKNDGQIDNLLNPVKKVEPKKEAPANPYGQAQSLTEEQLITFLGAAAECIAPMFRVIFCLLFATGGRIHEGPLMLVRFRTTRRAFSYMPRNLMSSQSPALSPWMSLSTRTGGSAEPHDDGIGFSTGTGPPGPMLSKTPCLADT